MILDWKAIFRDGISAVAGAFFSTLIASWVIPLPWTLVFVFLAISIFLGVWIYRLKSGCTIDTLRAMAKNDVCEKISAIGLNVGDGGRSVAEWAGSCQGSFYFFGISGGRTVKNPEVTAEIVRIARAKGDVRFLLLDPKAKIISRRAKDEGVSHEGWEYEINATVARLRDLNLQHQIDIKIRYYSGYPVWRMIVLDRRDLLLHYFLDRKQLTQSPLLHLTRTDSGLLVAFLKEFDEVWECSKDA